MEIQQIPTAPVNGTTEVQTISPTGTITAGTYKLRYRHDTTAALNWNATATQVRDALRALNEIQADGIATVTGGPTQTAAMPVTFGGRLAAADVALLQVVDSTLVGGSLGVAVTTPGVTATLRGHAKGSVVSAQDTGKLYVNEGTNNAPVWRIVTTT
jgi:hypothetical protein